MADFSKFKKKLIEVMNMNITYGEGVWLSDPATFFSPKKGRLLQKGQKTSISLFIPNNYHAKFVRKNKDQCIWITVPF